MPKKLKEKRSKTKGKKGSKKRKGKRKKKVKKEKEVPEPPPLHDLTKMYNKLVEEVEEFVTSRNKARKKRVESWYMTREMMSLRHDKEIYQKHMDEKMEDMENYLNELKRQLEEEKEELEKLIQERFAEMDKTLAGYKNRTMIAEQQLSTFKNLLLEFEPMMRELAALTAKLKDLQALIPTYELEANIKTRHLKNQYLAERAKLNAHLENELGKLKGSAYSHLMPILEENMTSMEMENRCNRWELAILDQKNFKLYKQREKLLEKRNRLNIEREYLSIDWAFNKLAQMEAKRKEERSSLKTRRRTTGAEEECELTVAFRAYLTKRLEKISDVFHNSECATLDYPVNKR